MRRDGQTCMDGVLRMCVSLSDGNWSLSLQGKFLNENEACQMCEEALEEPDT